MSTGDILFYRNKVDIPDYIIALWEGFADHDKGPFVHCAIDMGDGTKIEALMRGVSRSPINNSTVDARWDFWPDPNDDPKDKAAIEWLQKQLGQPYGYGDILDVILQHPIFEQHYDCSALAAKFLTLSGYLALTENQIATTTPEQLANLLGIQ